MCDTCGCSDNKGFKMIIPGQTSVDGHTHHHHSHEHPHVHGHDHEHPHDHIHKIALEHDVMSGNNLLAERNRGYFEAKRITAINFVSSPGAGKTCFLERTIKALKNNRNIYVIEGDQQTANDAERIMATGAKAIQINTGNGCHLDAHMVKHAVSELNVEEGVLLFIENVGNLVCPSLFDLGESLRIVIMSVTEGEDKPLKYPAIFASSGMCIINKIDLLPYLDFDMDKAIKFVKQVNPEIEIILLSAKTGVGFDRWLELIIKR
jgi:hydrogenase nickel incorporation protein HypB